MQKEKEINIVVWTDRNPTIARNATKHVRKPQTNKKEKERKDMNKKLARSVFVFDQKVLRNEIWMIYTSIDHTGD